MGFTQCCTTVASAKSTTGCSSVTHPLAQSVESRLGDANGIVVDGAVVAMHSDGMSAISHHRRAWSFVIVTRVPHPRVVSRLQCSIAVTAVVAGINARPLVAVHSENSLRERVPSYVDAVPVHEHRTGDTRFPV